MKAEHVNALIQGAQNTFTSFFGENASLGKVFLKGAPYSPEAVSVEISIVGQLQGRVFYNMSMPSALFVARKFMADLTELNEIAQSAVCEIANMISGQSSTVFFGMGLTTDITPPTLRVGATPGDFPDIQAGAKIFCVPLSFSDGSVFEIDVLMS